MQQQQKNRPCSFLLYCAGLVMWKVCVIELNWGRRFEPRSGSGLAPLFRSVSPNLMSGNKFRNFVVFIFFIPSYFHHAFHHYPADCPSSPPPSIPASIFHRTPRADTSVTTMYSVAAYIAPSVAPSVASIARTTFINCSIATSITLSVAASVAQVNLTG